MATDPTEGLTGASPSQLSWFAGNWEDTVGGDHVYLRIKHFARGLHGWEEKDEVFELVLVKIGYDEAVFCETNKADPRWVVYRLENPDRLIMYFTRGEAPTPTRAFLNANVSVESTRK